MIWSCAVNCYNFVLRRGNTFTVFKISSANFRYEYRLMNGSNGYEGRLEIRRNGGAWGTINGYTWTSVHASIACSQMGFSSSVLPPSTTQRFGAATGPMHVVVRHCLGYHTSLFECSHIPWDDSEFINDHYYDVELKCMPGKRTEHRKKK